MKELGLKDEAALQSYFINRIAVFLRAKNKTIVGWDEILEGGAPKDAVVTFWRRLGEA
jgi:hexosaminidase